MKELIADFTKQLKQALDIAKQSTLRNSTDEITNAVISGMGGSGIGGNITIEAVAAELRIPIVVNKDYVLPNYVNKHSLVIISSYSGDTEETVQSLEEALEKGAKIVCITSGGKIAETANKKNIDLILVPPGMPPRAALAYSVTQLLHILNFFFIIPGTFRKDIEAAIKLIDAEQKDIMKNAKETADVISDKLPVLYSTAKMESVALRFRQQLNENSKLLGWYNVFPEMNHNELEGWKNKNKDIAVIIFRNENDPARTAKRIDVSKEIIKKYTPHIIETYSKGNSVLEKMFYLIHWGDWVSYFVAEKNGTDMMDIRAINYLKSELSK
ncbi:MAG: Bifunctional phosphoglucose/phosphomannose isomerase [Bacteroidota bacterium]|nr:Bifunctional phosphoglucose/phosphomannose isomerase [Bacteroidota bacterium]